MKSKLLFLGMLLAVVVILIGTGCASKPKEDWNGRLGTYTYDQAVMELGPPNRQTTLSDGRTVAAWVVGHTGGGGLSLGVGGYSGHAGVGVSQSMGSVGYDKVLRLTFGPDGKLTEWNRN